MRGEVKSLIDLLTKAVPADYIVEEGVNNNWKYKKWKSGKFEAQVTASYTSNPYTTWNNYSWHYSDFTIPSFITTSNIREVFITSALIGSGISSVGGYMFASSSVLRTYIGGTAGGAQQINVSVKICGELT